MTSSSCLAVICLLAVTVSAGVFKDNEYEFLFTKWVQQHQKSYDAENFFHRFGVFKDNLDYIHEHNKENHTYTLGMNAFGDLTPQEFYSTRLGYKRIGRNYIRGVNEADLSHVTTIADSLDWRTEGAVTPIKDQGQCGSCWAFSATGSTEGAYFLAKDKLVSLSEQQLVDCSTANSGCDGGLMDYAFEWIIDNDGITDEASYPYTAKDGTCKSGKTSKATISSYADVTSSNDVAFKKAVNIGPLSVAIEADQSAFQFYSSGVFSGACGTSLDHGVLVVGYGIDSDPYYIVKNSWGTSWGEKGYMRMIDSTTGKNKAAGECGIFLEPSYPIV